MLWVEEDGVEVLSYFLLIKLLPSQHLTDWLLYFQPKMILEAVDAALKEFGRVDYLINGEDFF